MNAPSRLIAGVYAAQTGSSLGAFLPGRIRRNNSKFNQFCTSSDAKTETQPVDLPICSTAMTPQEITEHLDAHIVGQKSAKRAVAVALRNRWRRFRVDPKSRDEIHPKNILMVGPTGVGKTEIARRLAKLTGAPFIKVEMTKFSEVGFYGRDVEEIIADLFKVALAQQQNLLKEKHKEKIQEATVNAILSALVGDDEAARQKYRLHLQDGSLDDQEIMVDVGDERDPLKGANPFGGRTGLPQAGMIFLFVPPGSGPIKTPKRKMKLKDALPLLEKREFDKLFDRDEVHRLALVACEQEGIVFLDEMDKVVSPSGDRAHSKNVSSEGVQQDLLPLVEGTIVQLNNQNRDQIRTDHIMFIAAGAFHSVKPADMLAELQGRFPIRVELENLKLEDYYRILTEPRHNLVAQQTELLKTEGVELHFTDDGLREFARTACEANSLSQNIGARRLITVMERVMNEISFNAPEYKGSKFIIDKAYVRSRVGDLLKQEDFTKFML